MVRIIDATITRDELKEMAQAMFGNMVKAVVDVEKGVMVVGGELHADEEGRLLAQGSRQGDLWGINIYPEIAGDGFVEFDSLINLRPSHNNPSRGVDDEETRGRIAAIVARLVK